MATVRLLDSRLERSMYNKNNNNMVLMVNVIILLLLGGNVTYYDRDERGNEVVEFAK